MGCRSLYMHTFKSCFIDSCLIYCCERLLVLGTQEAPKRSHTKILHLFTLHNTPTSCSKIARSINMIRQSVDKALQANKDHQYALKVYTERLEAELASVDKLIVRHSVHNISSLANCAPSCLKGIRRVLWGFKRWSTWNSQHSWSEETRTVGTVR